jgi:hypothetical protein
MLCPNCAAGAHDLCVMAGCDCECLCVGPLKYSFQITSAGGEPIVTIDHDGHVIVNPKYTLDEAANSFWLAVIRLNPTLMGKS